MPGRLRTASRPSSTVIEEAPYPLAPMAAPLAFLVLLRGVLLGAATGGVRLLGWCRSDRRGCAPRAGPPRGSRACVGARGASLYSLLVPPTRTASRTPLERTQIAVQRPDWVRSPGNASRAGLRGHRPLVVWALRQLVWVRSQGAHHAGPFAPARTSRRRRRRGSPSRPTHGVGATRHTASEPPGPLQGDPGRSRATRGQGARPRRTGAPCARTLLSYAARPL
jgi:hypothetical protein